MERIMDRCSLCISNFKEKVIFAVKLLIFAGLLFGYLNRVLPQYDETYDASLIDKVRRLESIDGPKLVLLGNSNLSFGIMSEMLEAEIGMPVVNMGLDLELGNAFHEEMAKYNVCEGDIYIICHSDFADYEMKAPVAWITLENHYNLWRILRGEDLYPMLKAFPDYLKRSLKTYVTGVEEIDSGGLYSRREFNEYGDMGVFREGSLFTIFSEPVNPPSIDVSAIDRINELNKWLEGKGATLLVAGYPIGDGSLTADAREFEVFQEELEALLDCKVISEYTDYMYDYSYFYNSVLHLTTEGARMRTEQLIADIKRWQADIMSGNPQ